MVKHIVFWNVRNDDEKTHNMDEMKKRLTSLVGKIDGLISAEVGFNYNPKGYDLALYSIFKDKEALEAYQVNPEHLKVKEFVHSVITDRSVVDFEF
jgi:quinol monooxygenase YgiN